MNLTASLSTWATQDPSTVFSTFISRNIAKAPFLGRLECLTDSFRVGPIFRRVSLTRNKSRESREWWGHGHTPQFHDVLGWLARCVPTWTRRGYGCARHRTRNLSHTLPRTFSMPASVRTQGLSRLGHASQTETIDGILRHSSQKDVNNE